MMTDELLHLNTLLDLFLVSLLIYGFLFVLRRFRLTPLILGFMTLFLVYLFSLIVNLPLTKLIFQDFVKELIIIFAIIFQKEIRKYIEVLSFYSFTHPTRQTSPQIIESIEESVKYLAANKTGALFIFPELEPIDRYILNRYDLDGYISTPLILSIFDESSPGHDGAVIIKGNKIQSYGAYLVLDRPYRNTKKYGTRHLAAFGLAKKTDAFIIVISEERGTISVANNGELKTVSFEEFSYSLRKHINYTTSNTQLFKKFVLTEYSYLALSLIMSIFLWYKLIVGSTSH